MAELDLAHLQGWVGREESAEDVIDGRRVAQMAGTLESKQVPQPTSALPPAWHWLFFAPVPVAGGTGVDGHPSRGGFLPPVPLPRRMWAASAVTIHDALAVGEPAQRLSTVEKVEAKSGRGGELLFVTIAHRLSNHHGRLAIQEQQTIVYREPAPAIPKPSTPQKPPPASPSSAAPDRDMPELAAQWDVPLVPDPVLLFRYSALTFNGHRIHYDRNYAVQEEGYPGLVVQGPLIASLLLEQVRIRLPETPITSYSFRARRPLFVGAQARFCGAQDGDRLILWALTPDGELAMRLDATVADNG